MKGTASPTMGQRIPLFEPLSAVFRGGPLHIPVLPEQPVQYDLINQSDVSFASRLLDMIKQLGPFGPLPNPINRLPCGILPHFERRIYLGCALVLSKSEIMRLGGDQRHVDITRKIYW
jgi:hypothetical protein